MQYLPPPPEQSLPPYPPNPQPPPYPNPPYPIQPSTYGYYAPSYQTAVPVPQTSGFAIASLVCSLASWIIIPFIGAVIGVIMGHMARGEIRRSYGQKNGDGLARAGLVIGYIHIALCIVGFAFFLLLVLAFASDSSSY
jgi:hypothetical protein